MLRARAGGYMIGMYRHYLRLFVFRSDPCTVRFFVTFFTRTYQNSFAPLPAPLKLRMRSTELTGDGRQGNKVHSFFQHNVLRSPLPHPAPVMIKAKGVCKEKSGVSRGLSLLRTIDHRLSLSIKRRAVSAVGTGQRTRGRKSG